MTSKTCRGCGRTKPAEEFYRNRSMKDGRASRCKPCCTIQDRKRARGLPRSLRSNAPPTADPTPARLAELRDEIRRANLHALLDHPRRPPVVSTPATASRCYYREWRRAKRRQAS